MSHQTVSTIIIVLSSLIVTFSIFRHIQILKDKELKATLTTGNVILTLLIFIFWASMLVGGIFLSKENEIGVLILYLASHLMSFILLIQLIRDLIGFYKARNSKNNDKAVSLKNARQAALRSFIEFIIVSAIIIWFQDWLNALTF